MSDQGGSDLDVFKERPKKLGSDSKKKTLVGMNLPVPGSKAPPPPPPSVSKAPPPPPSVSKAPPPPPSASKAPPPPPSKAPVAPSSAVPASPPPSVPLAQAPPPSVPPARPPAFAAAQASGVSAEEDEHDIPVTEDDDAPLARDAATNTPRASTSTDAPALSATASPASTLAEDAGADVQSFDQTDATSAPQAAAALQAAGRPPAVSKAPPPPPTPSFAAPPPPVAPASSVGAEPPAPTEPPLPTPAQSEPLAPPAGPDNDWDDDDEKTTVFDRSDEESAQALLQKSPTPAAASPRPGREASSLNPSVSAASGSRAPSQSTAQDAALPSTSAAPSYPAAPASIAPSEQKTNKAGIYASVAALAAIVVALFFFWGGEEPGGLVISVAGADGTEVAGVKVLVDDAVVCESSSCKVSDLAPGSYLIKAEANGYKRMAGKAFEVAAGKQTAVNLELLAEVSTGLFVSSAAPGLTLSLDGKEVGPLPQELAGLKAGDHEIEVSGSKFIAPFKKTISLKEGETFRFEPELKLEQGQVTVQLGEDARDAKVYLIVDGKKRPLQKIIEKGQPLLLPADGMPYEIIAKKKGFEDFEEEVVFSVKEPTVTVTIDLVKEETGDAAATAPASARPSAPSTSPAPRPAPAPAAAAPAPKPAATGTGKLNINSIPVSNVILDGRPLGTTPQIGVSVPAGAHTVVFVHPQHGRKVRSVTVSDGGVATAAVRFP